MLDDKAFRAALDAMVLRVEVAARRIETDAAHIVEAAGKRNAPVLSGTLRRSFAVFPGDGTRVAPTVVYARRIELGFTGPDSLGRVYDQAPDPYLKPGVTSSLPAIMALCRSRVSAALRG